MPTRAATCGESGSILKKSSFVHVSQFGSPGLGEGLDTRKLGIHMKRKKVSDFTEGEISEAEATGR